MKRWAWSAGELPLIKSRPAREQAEVRVSRTSPDHTDLHVTCVCGREVVVALATRGETSCDE